MTLCLAWVPAAASSRLSSSPAVASAAPGQQIWTSTLTGVCCDVGAVSPAGSTVFVSGYLKGNFETAAYSGATGAQLWAQTYQPGLYAAPRAITVSPDGATVYVTGWIILKAMVTVAYDAATGKQLWASRYTPKGLAEPFATAVSPDDTTVYVIGRGLGYGSQSEFTIGAYAAATGKQLWVRHDNKVEPGYSASVAVSPDGTTVYATGAVGSSTSGPQSALTVAYRADGTLKWAARYKDPYPGGYAIPAQIVAGPGGGAVYVAGRATNKYGHVDMATFAYGAATGKRIWLRRANLHLSEFDPLIAVTPGGQTVIAVGPRNGDEGAYAIAAYNASTGRTRWSRLAPDPISPSGLFINPRGDTLFIGGSRNAAYSVAKGTLLWITSGSWSNLIGVNGDGTRLFGTWDNDTSITITAYQT